MAISLRNYQQEALDAVLHEFDSGIQRQLIVLPTGSGKTIIMAAIAKHFNKRTLILAHREELIQQAAEKFRLFWPEADIGICKAELDEIDRQIVIASVQTCNQSKRLAKLKTINFDLMMIDEAHHAAAESYAKIVKELGFNGLAAKLLIGVTATPDRNDHRGLGDLFQKIVFVRSMSTMIKAGYLCPVLGRKILTSISLKGVKTRMGDFVVGQLSHAVNTPERNTYIVQKYQLYAGKRKGIAFCADVRHCQDLAETFNTQGITAAAVWGAMNPEDRRFTLKKFKDGSAQVVTSCGVLTEGFDEPTVDCIVMARPTKSKGLYTQCLGRGLRVFPGKENCLVLDFTDKIHNINDIMSLRKSMPTAPLLEEHHEVISERENPEPVRTGVNEIKDTAFDILGQARFIWVPLGDDEYSLADDENNEIVIRPAEGGYVANLYYRSDLVRVVPEPLPLDYCSGVCEDFARQHLNIKYADATGSWINDSHGETATAVQKAFLQKHGIICDNKSKAEASIEIRRIVANQNKQQRLNKKAEPITQKQKEFLQHQGFSTEHLNKLDAMYAISRIIHGERATH